MAPLNLDSTMKINFAHLRERATNGGWINFAVFEADARSNTSSSRDEALANLTAKARLSGLRVDQSALAFVESGRPTFYGSKHLVDYLSRMGVPRWTHSMSV